MALYIKLLKTDRPVSAFPLLPVYQEFPATYTISPSYATPVEDRAASRLYELKTPTPRVAPLLADDYAVIELEYDEQAEWREAAADGARRPIPSVVTELEARGVEVVQDDHRVAPIFGTLGYLDLLIQATPAVTGALAVVLAAWLQKRGNHRVKLKVGDRELEARDLGELQSLLDVASKFEGSRQPASERDRVERLAHELWVLRGRPDGSPEVDWRKAEELIARFSGMGTQSPGTA
jgi:hypothetical protein